MGIRNGIITVFILWASFGLAQQNIEVISKADCNDPIATLKIYYEKIKSERNISEIIKLFIDIADIDIDLGKNEDANFFITKSVLLLTEHSNQIPEAEFLLGRCNELMGDLNSRRNLEKEAVKYYTLALQNYKKAKQIVSYSQVLQLRALNYFYIGDTLLSNQDINTLAALSKLSKVKQVYIDYIEILGILEDEKGRFPIAIRHYQEVITLYQSIGDYDAVFDNMLRLAASYQNIGEIQRGIDLCDSVIDINRRENCLFKYYIAVYYKVHIISELDIHLAIKIAEEAIDTLNKTNFFIHQSNYQKLLNKLYEKSGNYKMSLLYLNEYMKTQEKIRGVDVDQKIAKQQIEILQEQFEHEINKLSYEKKIVKLISQNQRNMIYYFILALSVILFVSLGNIRKLHYRLFLLKDFSFAMPVSRAVFIIFIGVLYLVVMLLMVNPLPMLHISFSLKIVHFTIMASLISSMVVIGISLYPDKWTEQVSVNKMFIYSVFVLLIGINVILCLYSWFFKFTENGLWDYLNLSFIVTGLILVPVIIIIAFIEKVLLRKHVQLAKTMTNQIHSMHVDNSDPVIKLFSEKSKETLSMNLSHLFFVMAQGNYTKIVYLHKDSIKKILILSPLKNIESQLSDYKSITRCHKSYLVNLSKIYKVTGNSHGYKLEIKDIDEEVPVSRGYFDLFNQALNRFSSEEEQS